MVEIQRCTVEQAVDWSLPLVSLLQDAVEGGASVGFLAPLSKADAQRYWTGVFAEIGQGSRVMLVAMQDGQLIGSVQLALAPMPNARHRAEVQKLLVLRSHRRQGIGQALMKAVEQAAWREGRHLLVLDTRLGDDAERLYLRLGYTRVGVIPRFARNAADTLDATVIFYRDLAM